MIVAIDGPAASGKSTVARALAARLGAHYLDTGAMYRTLAYAATVRGVPLDDEALVARLAERIEIDFCHADGSPTPTAVLLDGEDVTAAIRTPAADEAVSVVARLPRVRAAMVAQQRRAASAGETIVLEGRDIGTVVFPDAEVKVFLTASAEERARRRHAEMSERGHALEREAVRDGLERRDFADISRETGPLTPAPDAVMVDTTGMTIDEVVEYVAALAERHR
ncbi:MAG TPA: (d)CMP kinase [Coriobacteriia bacterium]|nr:(d)CMP kinase [Coriobacteriia bacterium]